MLMSLSDSESRFLDAPWLDGVDASVRLILWKTLDERSVAPGFALLEQNQANHRLWFVADGAVAVERVRPDGRPEVLADLSGPAIYGTTNFFRNSLPTMTLRATAAIRGWTLERGAYDQLRLDHPDAAAALALAVVQVLAERFDMLDRRLTSLLAAHEGDQHRTTEWANFRSRLFEEPAV